jgi:transcriptional antiterminator NusG
MAKNWYIVHAYSNFEKKVAESIQERAEIENLDSAFDEIIVPTEEVVELRRGRKINREKRFFPGYVLVNMELTDETFHLVKNTPKVSGFLGSEHGTKPHPVSQEEIDRIINRVEETSDGGPRPSVIFEIGEQVRVSEGPFASFNGLVEEIDEEKSKLKVAVSIFGRPTPVELQYTQVEKL